MTEICANIPQQFQVNVVILEGRHLPLKYKNTKVVISIGKKKRNIYAKTNRTDSPYYNDFCVFNFLLPLNVLLDKIVTVKVFQKTIIHKKRFLGGFKVDLATVWAQPNHQFYHKWAVLENRKKPSLGVRGFLKCDIAILSKGISIRLQNDQEESEVVEDNILVPQGGIKDRLRMRIICSVYRADSFSPYYKSPMEPKIAKPYIKISYSGDVKKTKIAKNKGPPVWNEEVIFFDLFPPLSQNILIEVCDQNKPRKESSLGNTKLDLRSLYEDGEKGFLPTFGPNFLYLYQPLKKLKHYTGVCTLQNSFTYFCRLLFAIRTEIIENPEYVKIEKKNKKNLETGIPPLLESNYFQYNQFILFATIFDVLLFESDITKKNVRIRLTVGPKKTSTEMQPVKKKKKEKIEQPPGNIEPPKTLKILTTCNTTPQLKCDSLNEYSFLAFSGKFPCVCVYGEWPDTLRRMYQSNVIKKAIQNCTKEVNEIKYDLQFEDKNRAEFSKKLKHTLSELSNSCETILLLTSGTKVGDTNLFRERKRVNRREIADIAKKAKITSKKKALKAEDELNNISDYLERLRKFERDPENSFPETEIWLLKEKKLIAQCTIKTEDIAFSSNFYENGILSGKPQTIVVRGKKDKIRGKLDIFVWFGLAENFMKCLDMLPSGFEDNPSPCSANIALKVPSEIIYEEKHHFQCRAHIFQAGIAFGFDKTGLADCFVRVIVLGQSQSTRVRQETLSPIWDETLLFPQVTLHGPSSYIKNHSTTITVEVFDQDGARSKELIGRSFVIPVVKLKEDPYVPPHFPPKLKWEKISSESKDTGRVLMVVELLELSDNVKDIYPFDLKAKTPFSIPPNIRPLNTKYRLEIIFWGVRQIRKKKYLKNKVFVTIESAERLIKSPVLHNLKHKKNFPFSLQLEEIELPVEYEYAPPLSVKLYHIGSVTHKTKYVANCIIPSIRQFYVTLLKESEKVDEKEIHVQIAEDDRSKKEFEKRKKKTMKKWFKKKEELIELRENFLFSCVKIWRFIKCKVFKRKCIESAYELKPVNDDEKLNWWIKYYASTEDKGAHSEIPTIKIYNEELEAQPQFKGFMDFLYTFDMVTGHERKNKKRNTKGKVKAALKLYKIPDEGSKVKKANEKILKEGLLAKSPTNVPEKVIVRVYVVGAKNLPSRDIYGKCDPYLFVQVGNHTINDRRHYAPKQVNPTFGKCFEFKAIFPEDYLLQVKIIDYDKFSRDDLIGVTTIDIENRYYSKYHASCGIAKVFETEGYNFWRDIYQPTQILKMICERSALQPPVIKYNEVLIDGHIFHTPASGVNRKEIQALQVLNSWHELPIRGFPLVPEHVETRSLYHPSLPGIEQGKLEMWVDIFPADFRYLPPKVDITPQPAEPMELRAIVWNVDDVVLDDTSLIFRDKMSDIYVKGWILSLEEEMQKTDIHYRSLDGEGNFNWRFIFHFNYIPSERKMTVRKKINAFDMSPEERKLHCKLEIQIWDNDTFGDDYLGTLILELCAMPKGAKLSSRCTLKMLAPNAAKINLFKIRKTRGWWPFRRHKENPRFGNEFDLTGKIDLELEILTEAEAKLSPVGKGRGEPNPLPPPDRPVTSFNWILNPGKVLRYIIWRKIGRCLIIFSIILIFLFFFLITLYSFPNYLVKKMLRA